MLRKLRNLFIGLALCAGVAYAVDVTIEELDARGTLLNTDLLECEDPVGNASYKCILSELEDLFFTNATDLDVNGALGADTVAAAEMADADHGDFSWSSGSGTLDADVVAAAEMADADHGEVVWASGVATIDDVAIDADAMADADHGEITWASGVATVDDDVIDADNIADEDHGDFTYATSSATLDADVVAAAEMADADHGDIQWTSGVATVEGIQFGAAFPTPDATGDMFVVTDDSASGACDSGAGSAISLCYWDGDSWEPVGDGNTGGGLTDDAEVIIGDGSSGDTVLIFNGDAGTDCSITHDVSADTFVLNCPLSTPRTAAPAVTFGDSDADDDDINASIVANATATGTGAENVDVTFNQQVGGSLVAFITSDADADVRVHRQLFSQCILIEDPATDEIFHSFWKAPYAVTITEISCQSTAGTSVALDLEIDTVAVNGSAITCTTSEVVDASFAGDTTMADGDHMDLDFGTVTGSVTQLNVCFEYTVD